MQSAVDALVQFHDAAHVKKTGERQRKFQYMTLEERVKLLDLRASLITEEYNETIEALSEFEDSAVGIYDAKTKEHLAKEIADLLYVLIGTCVDLDIPIAEVFTRVHRNNMAKVLTATLRSDGKLVKSPSHPHVVLNDIVR